MIKKPNHRGITLIEVILLVAIIIASLFFFLGIRFLPYRPLGYKVSCMSNLKQIGIGLKLYSDIYYDMPPHGPKSLLCGDGQGLIPDETVFWCPFVYEHHPMGDYLRDVNWDKEAKPNKIIVGDAPKNHEFTGYTFLFKDGHAIIHNGTDDPPKTNPVKNVKGVADSEDSMYSGEGDLDITSRTWLRDRD